MKKRQEKNQENQNEYKKVLIFFSSWLIAIILISIVTSFYIEKEVVITLAAWGIALAFVGIIMASLYIYQDNRGKK